MPAGAAAQADALVLPAGPTTVPAGDLTRDATWTAAGSPYVLDGQLRILSGATLTIEPGTVVKFVPGSGLHGVLLIYGGRLLAEGTGADPIVFTSYFDDTASGDTDGGGRAPERGDWVGLGFTAPSAQEGATMPLSVLDNVSVRYGGEGYSCAGGALVGVGAYGKLVVTRSEFVDSETVGISAPPLQSGEYFSVSHSRFADSVCGMWASGGDVFNNVFEDTLSHWSLYSSSGDAKGLRVIGNWMYQGAAFTLNGTRENANAIANAFMMGVNNETGDQDHVDLRFNYWGGPRAHPGECVTYGTWVPAVDYTWVPGDCSDVQKLKVKKYFTSVLPMAGEPPLPQVGPGATLMPPGGLPVGGVAFGQTFGGDCNCTDPTKDTQHKTQRPVNTATGSLVEFFTDISLPGLGVPLTWTRTYNSLDITTGPMGPGWTFGYNASVKPWGSKGAVLVRAEDGKQVIFEPKTGGGFDPPPGVRSELTVVSGGGYRLTKLDRSYLTFDSSGRLTEMRDHLDQGLSLGYANSKLSTVTDAAGRVLTLTYTGDLLTRVALPDGRDVEYSYTEGYLTGATDLRGTTTDFAYDVNGFLKSAQDAKGHFAFRNTFDPETGRVVSQLDPRGKETTFAWDLATQTSTMIDPGGGQWVEVYQNNLLVERRDPLGNSLKYGYDDELNRISVIDAHNKETRFSYDAEGNMLTRTAPATLSYQEAWTYTAFNTVDTYTNRRGQVTDYDYDTSQRLVRIKDPLNRETDFTYTAQNQIDTITDPRNKVTDFGYDADGNRTSVLSPEGSLTTFGFDGSGRNTSITEPRGNVGGGVNPAEYTTEFTYNDADQRLTVTDALDHVTAYSYDEAGNLATLTDAKLKVTEYDYNADNQVITVTDPRGAVTKTTYDDRGNLASVTTADGTPEAGTTTLDYDAANRLESEVTPRGNVVGAANPVPFTWTYTYDANGNLETESNPTAGTTTHSYDEIDRRESTVDALDNETLYGYDENSNLTSVTDPLNRVTSYEFDVADQLDKVIDAYTKETDYDYDDSGNRTSVLTPMLFETTWTYDGDGRLATEVEPRGNVAGANASQFTTDYDYDPAGHLEQITDPLNHATIYGYDRAGNLATRKDANTHTTTYAYDALNLLASVTGPGTPSATGTTTYAYDDSGNLHTRTDAKTHVTTYDHDLAGRVTTRTTPVGVWTYDYDVAGNLTEMVTAAGNATPGVPGDGTIVRTYDPVGRLTGIDYSVGTPDVAYTYDELRLASMVDGAVAGAGTESYGYDDAGQLETITRGAAVFAYEYDDLGRVTKRTQPDGTITTQTWDDDSRQATVADPTASATYGYDEAGNPVSTILGNGVGEIRTYDRNGWLKEILAKRISTNAVVSKHTYTRDNVGNPTAITRAYGALITATESNVYDAADRVTTACYVASCNQRSDYTYDAVGNRLTENRVGGTGAGLITSTYNTKDQLTQTSRPATLPLLPPIVTAYTYDDNGNQTSQGTSTYAYDLDNRLTSATVAGASTTYGYDGNGVRLSATTGTAQPVSYTWDTNNPLPEMVRETSAAGTRRFLNGRVGEPVAETIPGTGAQAGLHYLHLDDLGSIRAVTNADMTTKATYSYEAFGTHRGSPTNQATLDNAVGFAGEYQDAATGLHHLRARDYDATTGRFTALDPIAQDITDPYVAAYAYVKNQPTVFTDPSGLCPWCAVAIGVAIAGAAYGAEVALTDEEFDLQRLAIEMAAGGIGAGVGYRVYKAGAGLATTRLSGAVTGSASAVAGETTYSLAAGHGLPSLEETLAALIFGGAAGCLMPPGAIGVPLGGTGAANSGNRVFWSGGDVAKNAAADYAGANGAKTLEMTLTGRALEKIPYNRFTKPVTGKLWDAASWRFARSARGDAHVFFGPNAPRPGSVFARIEGPILDRRGNTILQHFLE